MKPTAIFLPTLALMLWTLLVLVQVPIRRFMAYFRGRVHHHITEAHDWAPADARSADPDPRAAARS